jgi:hypothetical protein
MNSRPPMVAAALVIASFCPLRADENLVAYKSLTPELAFDLARAALDSCRSRGFQVAVAVVDRFGVTQVMLRDRFAGPHTPSTAAGKAWTAASFRTSTTELNAISQPRHDAGGHSPPSWSSRHRRGPSGRGHRFAGRSGRCLRSSGWGRRRSMREGRYRRHPRQAGVLTELQRLQWKIGTRSFLRSEAPLATALKVRAICELAHFRLNEIVP